MKVIAVVSGGMDSTVLTYDLVSQGHEVKMLSVDYGQRHRTELAGITNLISRSSLTGNQDVPDGHYAEDNMRQTVVPNRNSIMLNVAAGYAVTAGADAIATAVHAGDHYIYPDCRPEFTQALQTLLLVANEGFISPGFQMMAPYVAIPKDAICARGEELGVKWEDTWSCYKGGDVHCGSCGTCYERREAFDLAGVPDPTEYLAFPEYADPR
jgi:7-cyano-7-deazaguanine synthase